jgi:hypothetical protein
VRTESDARPGLVLVHAFRVASCGGTQGAKRAVISTDCSDLKDAGRTAVSPSSSRSTGCGRRRKAHAARQGSKRGNRVQIYRSAGWGAHLAVIQLSEYGCWLVVAGGQDLGKRPDNSGVAPRLESRGGR